MKRLGGWWVNVQEESMATKMRVGAIGAGAMLSALIMLSQVGCEAAMERVVRAQATAPASIDASDGALHVVLCGTGSPLADADRAAACTAVLAGGHFFIIDAGPGSWENLQLWRLPIDGVSGVLLTHFHSDHIGELGEVMTQSWVASGRAEPLPVFGPPGVSEVVDGFNRAYAFDRVYRRAHHTPEFMPERGGLAVAHDFAMPAPGEATTVFDADGLRIMAFAVDHAPVQPAVGYRIEFGGRSVVVSGDTTRSSSLVKNAQGADLLIHEALSFELMGRVSRIVTEAGRPRLGKLAGDVLDYHTSPAQAKEIADEAGVELLVLTHNVPPLRNALIERFFVQGVDMDGVVIGDDGLHFTLPADSQTIEQASF